MKKFEIIAHRGASSLAPENTLAAFRQAHALQTEWIEFDVTLTKDRVPIIFHDKETHRTTNLIGRKISTLPLTEIKQLDAGSWFSPEFAGEKIPTFAETLQFLATHNIHAHIELKPNHNFEVATVTQVLAEFRAIWPTHLTAIFSSFSVPMLRTLRQHDSTLNIAFIHNRWHMDNLDILHELNCQAMHLNARYITEQQVHQLKAANFQVRCFTINHLKRGQILYSWGVDGVFTEHPERFVDFEK